MSRSLILFGLIVCVLSSCSGDRRGISTGQLTCPKEISVKQTLLTQELDWESFQDDAPLQLISVRLYDGHPREKASLVPDQETEVGGHQTCTWRLVENGKRRYWIACYYDHTRIVLTRLIDPEVSTCEVTLDSNVSIAGQPVVLDVSFR